MELKSKDFSGNFNGHWDTIEDKKHLKTDRSDKRLSVGSVSRAIMVVLECLPVPYQKWILMGRNERQTGLGRGSPRLSNGKVLVKGARGIVHHGGLEVAAFSASTTTSRDRNWHTAMVANMFLSEDKEWSLYKPRWKG